MSYVIVKDCGQNGKKRYGAIKCPIFPLYIFFILYVYNIIKMYLFTFYKSKIKEISKLEQKNLTFNLTFAYIFLHFAYISYILTLTDIKK